jgi:signal transduction histidine kinase
MRAGSLEPGAMVGEMTASIAHELNQPLATIMSKRTLPSASIGARTQGPVGAVVLNFAVNSVDAVGSEPKERRRMISRTRVINRRSALVTIVDFGHVNLRKDLRTFSIHFSRPMARMGIGVSIARSIV